MDEERLRRVLGVPAWAWLRERLRRRIEEGRGLPRRIVLREPDGEQRRAANALFATPGRTGTISIRLDELAAILREADLADDLRQALELCDGPLRDLPAERRDHAGRWQAVVDAARALPLPAAERLGDPRLWQRLSAGDAAQAQAWIADLERCAALLPRRERWQLQELAAALTGDAHALDRGRPLGRLLLLGQLGRDDDEAGEDPITWRRNWARLGVQVPQTTAPVLCLNLRWRSGPFVAGWHAHAEAGEPLRLTVRQLAAARPAPQRVVHVCENPCVVEAAADRLGATAAPLVCVDGRPTTAALLLLERLAEAGAALRYHGDFDWPGIAIANGLVERLEVQPWRFRACDLRAHATLPGPPLSGDAIAACWDPALAPTLGERGRALHEESLLDVLLADLGPEV